MRMDVRLTVYDLLEHTKMIAADGKGILSGSTLTYREKDAPHALHHIRFEEDRIVLERNGDVSSRITLMKKGQGKCIVHSEYGDLSLDSRLTDWRKDEHLWSAEYYLVDGMETVTGRRLIWELKESGDE